MARSGFRTSVVVALWLLALTLVATSRAGSEPIDWQRAQNLHRREQRGESLSDKDKAYLERAKQARRVQAAVNTPPPARATTGLVPLPEMGEGLYQGQTGGLYGHGQNVPPEAHLQAAQEADFPRQPGQLIPPEKQFLQMC